MAATVTARMADGFESGPPIAKLNELRHDSTKIVTQLPTMAASTACPECGASVPPKIRVANPLA